MLSKKCMYDRVVCLKGRTLSCRLLASELHSASCPIRVRLIPDLRIRHRNGKGILSGQMLIEAVLMAGRFELSMPSR